MLSSIANHDLFILHLNFWKAQGMNIENEGEHILTLMGGWVVLDVHRAGEIFCEAEKKRFLFFICVNEVRTKENRKRQGLIQSTRRVSY